MAKTGKDMQYKMRVHRRAGKAMAEFEGENLGEDPFALPGKFKGNEPTMTHPLQHTPGVKAHAKRPRPRTRNKTPLTLRIAKGRK